MNSGFWESLASMTILVALKEYFSSNSLVLLINSPNPKYIQFTLIKDGEN